MPKAVFFDWDGTLVESFGFLHKAHNHVRHHFGMPLYDADEFRANMKYSSRQIYPLIYGDQADKAMDVLAAYVNDNHLEHLELMEGAAGLLASLHKEGVKMGVVSNKRQAFLTREIAHLGWQDYFSAVVGAGIAARDKPEADPLLLAVTQAGLEPGADILYIGDTEPDFLCAAAAGCSFAFLYHKAPDNPLIKQYNPPYIAKDCAELAHILCLPPKGHK